jgi:hypothetical protein
LVSKPSRKKGQGFKPWTEADVEAYYRRWPLGTHERVWLDLLLYSGLGRGDVVRYGRQHVRNGIGKMRPEKGGDQVEVTLPILPVLADTLAVGPCGDPTFIVGKAGQAIHERELRQCLQGCMQGGRHPRQVSTRGAQDRGYDGGKQWGDRLPAQGTVRMAE